MQITEIQSPTGASETSPAPDVTQMTLEPRQFLTRGEAAKFLTTLGLPIAATTLAKKAVTGSGPLYRITNGKAVYEVDDLQAWATSQLGPKRRSTAERQERENAIRPNKRP